MHYYDEKHHRILNLDHFAFYSVVIHDGQHEVRAFYVAPPPERQNAKPEPWEVLCKGNEHECHTFLNNFAIEIGATKRKLSPETLAMGKTRARDGR